MHIIAINGSPRKQWNTATLLKKAVEGSPIYLGNVTGEMRSFLERLMFQYLVYDGKYSSLCPKDGERAFEMGVQLVQPKWNSEFMIN